MEYRKSAPRWIPRPPAANVKRTGEHDWGESWRSEISTFLQYAVLALVFIGKQRFMSR